VSAHRIRTIRPRKRPRPLKGVYVNVYLKSLIVLSVFTLMIGGIAGWQIGAHSAAEHRARLSSIAERQQDAEVSARSLVESLGSLCTSFDFYFKHDMARGAFRPVRCSPARTNRTVLLAYGFDKRRTQEAWVNEWGGLSQDRGTALVEDGTWAVEVLEPEFLDDVRSIVL
jgi:hypothetical protein